MTQAQNKFSESFLTSVQSLGIEPQKLDKALKIIDEKYNQHKEDVPSEPIPAFGKAILNVVRIASYKKLKNFSDSFLMQMMDLNLERPQFYALMELVDKNYNENNNSLHSSPKNK